MLNTIRAKLRFRHSLSGPYFLSQDILDFILPNTTIPPYPSIWPLMGGSRKQYFTPQDIFYWNLLVGAIIVVYTGVIQFNVFFQTSQRGFQTDKRWEYSLSLVCTIILIGDVYIQSKTSYYRNGQIETSLKHIFVNYVSSNFLPDLLAFIGIFLYITEILRFLGLLFLFKAKSLIYHHKLIDYVLADQPKKQIAYRLLAVLVIYYLFANFFSCLFFYIDYNLSVSNAFDKENGYLWLYQTAAMDDIIGLPLLAEYLYAIYWSFITATTTGYGDITPKNYVEIFYVLLLFAPIILFYSYLTTSISQNLNERNESQRTRTHNVSKFSLMLQKTFSEPNPKFVNIICHYLDFTTKYNTGDSDYQLILSSLSKNLQDELKYELFSKPFAQLLKYCPSMLTQVADLFKQRVIFTNEIFSASNIFIYLVKGTASLKLCGLDPCEFEDQTAQIRSYQQENVLNFDPFFMGYTNPFTYFHSKDIILVYIIEHTDFAQLPSYNSLRNLRLETQLGKNPFGLSCEVCGSAQHLISSCPIFTVTRLTAKTSKKNNQQKEQNNRERKKRKDAKNDSSFQRRFQEKRHLIIRRKFEEVVWAQANSFSGLQI